ncbi:hypothetical protein HHK36_014953 [Tetracentron sinense]|uniref:CRM domain-containing protein n=1 Tax=Tetracentron sinense TaxID=13715 RepID=A0A834Z3R3_TETSI|nr:hypothetical protein HHK36_014953 [Tetracentron sinense]
MSTVLFLSTPNLSNTPQFPTNSNPAYISISSPFNTLFPKPLKTPKPLYSSKPLKVVQSESNTPSTSNIQSPSPHFSFSSEPFSCPDTAIKMPTAPWMKGPLLLPPNRVLDLSKTRKKNSPSNGEGDEKKDRSLTDRVSGGRGNKAMRKIVESITKLRETHTPEKLQERAEEFDFRVPLERVEEDGNSRMPWAKEERIVFPRAKKEKVVTEAELVLPEMLLKRLRGDAAKMTKWVKVKKAGVTQMVVDEIKLIWKKSELAMVKFDMPLCRNMDRAREIVELTLFKLYSSDRCLLNFFVIKQIKTGGLVVWIKKDVLVIYRGCSYQLTSKAFSKLPSGLSGCEESLLSKISIWKPADEITISQVIAKEIVVDKKRTGKDGEEKSLPTSIFVEKNGDLQSINGSLYEREADRLLDGLGPRFIDWWMPKPLPVDADLLPEVVPGFRSPFRLCPPHVRPKLMDDELTYFRKLARPLPTHFVLGRNTKLQGLAAAIMKLWEKSLIVKIAVKWGIPNTNNEQMAWELKASSITKKLLRL